MKIFWKRTRATPEPAVASGRDRCGEVGGHTTANCRLPSFLLFVVLLAMLLTISACTSAGYKGPIQTADGQKMEEPDYNY